MKRFLICLLLLCSLSGMEAHRTGVYFYFDNAERHVYEDENIKMEIVPWEDGTVAVGVRNKTEKIIFVDKGASFFFTNGKDKCMFSSKVDTYGTMSVTSVNLGQATGAKGSLGAALRGITVSRGSSFGTSYIEKRIVPIAPDGSEIIYSTSASVIASLQGAGIYSVGNIFQSMFWSHHRYIENGRKIKMKKGFIREYPSEEESRLTYKSLIRYSFTENDPSPMEATVSNFLRAIVVDSHKGVKHYETTPLKYCAKYRDDKDNFFLLGSKKDGQSFNEMQYTSIMGGISIAVLLLVL